MHRGNVVSGGHPGGRAAAGRVTLVGGAHAVPGYPVREGVGLGDDGVVHAAKRLAAEGGVQIAFGEVHSRGRPPVTAGQRPQ
eukprot:1182364-Prorocentrum_minimum.AAC.2